MNSEKVRLRVTQKKETKPKCRTPGYIKGKKTRRKEEENFLQKKREEEEGVEKGTGKTE